MRVALVVAVALACGCGARTALLVGETSAPDATRVTPDDAGADSAIDASHPVDAGADVPLSPLDSGVDSSSQTVDCIWGGVGTMGISEVACPGGSACIPAQGCVAPNEIPAGTATSACGVLACASACMCSTGSFVACNCGNIP